jgi:hypothetical protein
MLLVRLIDLPCATGTGIAYFSCYVHENIAVSHDTVCRLVAASDYGGGISEAGFTGSNRKGEAVFPMQRNGENTMPRLQKRLGGMSRSMPEAFSGSLESPEPPRTGSKFCVAGISVG